MYKRDEKKIRRIIFLSDTELIYFFILPRGLELLVSRNMIFFPIY